MRKRYQRYQEYHFLKLAITQIDIIQKTIFFSYLDQYYADNFYFYEKKLHKERISFFSYRLKLPKESFYTQIDSLFEVITLLGSLRYQIQDHTTFAVCETEFKEISKSISIILRNLFNKNCDIVMINLLNSIEALQSIYYSAFQVVCKNPAVFLIFIQNLQTLHDKLTILNFDAKNWKIANISIPRFSFPLFRAENFLIYFYRADRRFRKETSIILKSCNEYFTSLVDLILKKRSATAFSNDSRFFLEKNLVRYTPLWVYGHRLGVSLRPGHQHFLIMIARVEQILFCIHAIAKYPFEIKLIHRFHDAIISYALEFKKVIQALLDVLSLARISEKISDLNDEVIKLETILSNIIPDNLELLDISKDYIYLVALVENCKDMRLTLLQLVQAID